MSCKSVGLALALLLTNSAFGQDMPLSEILKANESWREVQAEIKKRSSGELFVTSRNGVTYSTKPGEKAIFIEVEKNKSVRMEVPFAEPRGLTLIHNEGTLVVGDAASKHLWAYRVKKDGSLDSGDRYYTLRVRKEDSRSETTVLTADLKDRVYAATKEGIQVYDPTGRMCGVLMVPFRGTISDMRYVGEKFDELQIDIDGKRFVRKMIANETTKK